jgi:hypothetical protein
MASRASRGRTIALLIAIPVLVFRPIHAYIDPSSGGTLLQMLLGGSAALAIVMSLVKRRLLRPFRRRSADEGNGE